jgi:ATP-dependent Clp protease ATP-binding subunit ClpA
VILFDEIEKAHPDVWNTFLQILDEGRLTDAKGRRVNFKNTVIVMTSNLGSEVILDAGKRSGKMGFTTTEDEREDPVRERVMGLLQERFKPEFLNRLDEIIVFRALCEEQIGNIVELQIARIADRLKAKRIGLKVTEKAKKLLARKGYDPMFGARPLKRTLQHEILDPLAMKIIEGTVKDEQTLTVDAKEDAIALKVGK